MAALMQAVVLEVVAARIQAAGPIQWRALAAGQEVLAMAMVLVKEQVRD